MRIHRLKRLCFRATALLVVLAAQATHGQENTVTFDNKSGKPALVKLAKYLQPQVSNILPHETEQLGQGSSRVVKQYYKPYYAPDGVLLALCFTSGRVHSWGVMGSEWAFCYEAEDDDNLLPAVALDRKKNRRR